MYDQNSPSLAMRDKVPSMSSSISHTTSFVSPESVLVRIAIIFSSASARVVADMPSVVPTTRQEPCFNDGWFRRNPPAFL